MRILLIYPPVTIYGTAKVEPHPPLGLAYLAAVLEKKGYPVRILDALAEGISDVKKKGNLTRIGLSESDIQKKIKEYNPDLVGVSAMFTAFAADAYNVVDLVKKVNPKITVVLGGAHVSIDPKAVLGKNKNINIAVKGEGEVTFLNLVKALEKKRSLVKVTGITYRLGRKIIQNPPAQFIKNLDEIPFPARHLLPMDVYHNPDDFVMRFPLTSMVTSRGCPGRCVYCSIHSIWGHTWRGRSAKNVVDEIEHLVKDFGIREIHFQDDSMSIDKRRMNEICDEVIGRRVDIKWTTPNGIAHWTLDKPLLKKMKKAGCYRVTFGFESGNPEMRRWVGKPYKLEQAKEITQFANRIGMWTIATNILGFPYETKAQMQDTINFAIDSDCDFALFFRLGPRWGTPIFEIFKKEGWLPKDERKLYSESVACDTKYVKGKELYKIQSEAYSRFLRRRLISFLNPLRMIRKIHSTEDLVYILRMSRLPPKIIMDNAKLTTGVTSKTFRS